MHKIQRLSGMDRINAREKSKDAMYIDEISTYMASLILYDVFNFHQQSMKSQSSCHFLNDISVL